VGGGGGGVAPDEKVAVTLKGDVTVSVHVPVPEHAPLQPVNVEPAFAMGVNRTTRPDRKLRVQVAPQSMPDGEE